MNHNCKLNYNFLLSRYWAVAIPIYLATVFVSLVFVGYPSLGLCLTPTLDDVRNVTDEHAFYYGDDDDKDDEQQQGRGVPARVGDVDLGTQLETVYSREY